MSAEFILQPDGTPMRVWGSLSQEAVDAIKAEEAKLEEVAAKQILDDREARNRITANNAERAAKMSPKEKAEAAALLGADEDEVGRMAEEAKRGTETGFQCGCGDYPKKGAEPVGLRSVQGHARRMGCKPESIVGPDGKKVPVVGMGG